MTTVSFQGERGAYGEAAAQKMFVGAKTIPCKTFTEVVDAAESGRSACAIIPVENSIAGSVGQTYDILRTAHLYIVAETYHHIEHCLIGRGALGDVTKVYSHPQALAQCSNFLESLDLKSIPEYDTAGSVRIVSGMGLDAACIASEHAAHVHGMPVIKRGISNVAGNYTRFVGLALKPITGAGSGNYKTSIIASLPHKEGALHSLLDIFVEHGINLARIESRPKVGESWRYDFFIDLECDQERADSALVDTKKLGTEIKRLGSYKAASVP